MITLKLIFVFFLFLGCCYGGNCPFNKDCDCNGATVICTDCATFPSFANNSYQIWILIIHGKYTNIPAMALAPLQGLQPNSHIYLQGSLPDLQATLVVDTKAFHTYSSIEFHDFWFFDFNMSLGLPSTALENIAISDLYFISCLIPSIDSAAFDKLLVNSITINDCNLTTIAADAFQGLTLGLSSTLIMEDNRLTEISLAFKKINATDINLDGNAIFEIKDFAFCDCKSTNSCSNGQLQTLQLGHNPIALIGNDSFINLPKLIILSLTSSRLTSIPSTALSRVGPSLEDLDLSFNNITTIGPNSFYNFACLVSLALDYNPISVIDPGAFNGISKMGFLNIFNLDQLQIVDGLITYGMSSIGMLTFMNCKNLHNIMLTDYTKLPSSLNTIKMSSGNDIRQLSSEFQYWLTESSTRYIEISTNKNFICTNQIKWMAKFALCNPAQIAIELTYCNGTSTSLADYLSSFNPICK